MSKEKFDNWNDVKKELNTTPEQEAEIQLEVELIQATIEARKKANLSQQELSEKSGVKQPNIAKLEAFTRTPQTTTLIKLLYPMGYTLKVVPIEQNNTSNDEEEM